jgi:hypothetical protein
MAVVEAGIAAIGMGSYAEAMDSMLEQAKQAERNRPGSGKTTRDQFDQQQRRAALSTIAGTEYDTRWNYSMASADSPQARKALELERKIQDARRANSSAFGGQIEQGIRDLDRSETAKSVKDMEISNANQKKSIESQYQTMILMGRERLVQNAMIQKKLELEASGVAYSEDEKNRLVEQSGLLADLNYQVSEARKGADAWAGAWNKAGDALTDFVMTGKINVGDFANSVIRDLIRINLQRNAIEPMANALGGMIKGSGGDGILGSIGSAFGGMFGFGGTRATGGDVTGGKDYIVGEFGPERFRAPSNGTIVPSGGGDVNVTVNVSAGGSPQSSGTGGGEADSLRQFGDTIASMVNAEIMRQQRPGGLLNRI